MTKNMKKTRRYSVAALTMLLSATFACGLAFSDRGGQGGSTLEAAAAEPLSVTKQVFGDGNPSNGGFKHEHVNDMVGKIINWPMVHRTDNTPNYTGYADASIANSDPSYARVTDGVPAIKWIGDSYYKYNASASGSGNAKYTTKISDTGITQYLTHDGERAFFVVGASSHTSNYEMTKAWETAIKQAPSNDTTLTVSHGVTEYANVQQYIEIRMENGWTATESETAFQDDGTYKTSKTAYHQSVDTTTFEVDSGGNAVKQTSGLLGDSNDRTGDVLAGDAFSYGRLAIPTKTWVILDLKGKTINRAMPNNTSNTYQFPSVFVTGTYSRFEIWDSTAKDTEPGTGKITGGKTFLADNGLDNSPKGGAVNLRAYSRVTLHSGAFTENVTHLGGGFYGLTSSQFYLFDGSISGNSANMGGGTYCSQNSGMVFNMFGGEVSNNDAATGGGLCANWRAYINVYGGKIQNNVANNGGGIYILEGAYVQLYGGEISHNGATTAGGGVYIHGKSLGVYVNGPAVVKDNYTVTYTHKYNTAAQVTIPAMAFDGSGKQTAGVTADTNRKTNTFTLKDDEGNDILQPGSKEKYTLTMQEASNLYLVNGRDVTDTANNPQKLPYADIRVMGPLSADGKTAEIYVSPSVVPNGTSTGATGTAGNRYGIIMRGFTDGGFSDPEDGRDITLSGIKYTLYPLLNSDNTTQYNEKKFLKDNGGNTQDVSYYFKTDNGADLVEKQYDNGPWVEILDLTHSRTADVHWQYRTLKSGSPDENGDATWDWTNEWTEEQPAYTYNGKVNWLEGVRLIYNKFDQTKDSNYDQMRTYVVSLQYVDGKYQFQYTLTYYGLKSGITTSKKATDYDTEHPKPNSSTAVGGYFDVSVEYFLQAGSSSEKTKTFTDDLVSKDAGTYTFAISQEAIGDGSGAMFSRSDIITQSSISFVVNRLGLTVTGVEITKTYDGKIDVTDDLNTAYTNGTIHPTIAGGLLYEHRNAVSIVPAKDSVKTFSDIILDSPDVGTHISTKFPQLEVALQDNSGGDKISRNYTVAGDLSNITVIITPAVLKNGTEGHTGGVPLIGPSKAV